jgi:hypothetical protein
VSTILKALKRLDEQRRADASPRTLEQQVIAGSAALPGSGSGLRNKWPLVAGGAAGALLIAAASWIAMRDQAAPAVAAPAAAARAQQPAPSFEPRGPQPARGAPVAGTPLDAAMRSGLRAPAAREDVAASARPPRADEPGSGSAAAATALAAGSPAAAERPTSAAPPLVAQASSGLEIPRERAPLAIAAEERVATPPAPFAAEARSARVDAPAAPASAGVESSTSASGGQPLQRDDAGMGEPTAEPRVAAAALAPELWVERTQWHPTPAKRSALVRVGADETREVREGDSVGGLVVKEIRPSGVLFLRDGAEFKRAVGER